MLHETLWQQNADITQRCLEHAFVRGLDGFLILLALLTRY